MRGSAIEDEFADEVELSFHSDGTCEVSILSGEALSVHDRSVEHDPRGTKRKKWVLKLAGRVIGHFATESAAIDAMYQGRYVGGFVLNRDNGEKLVESLKLWLQASTSKRT